MCTCVKDEGRWLKAWMEWHLLVGVEHFFLYDDGSTDDTLDIIHEYVDKGVATFMGASEVYLRDSDKPKHKIRDHLVHCYEHVGPHLDWMMFLDPDEFIFPIDSYDVDNPMCSLAEFLDARCPEDQTHVMARWQMFGSNGYDRHPAGSLPETHFWSGGACDRLSQGGGKGCETENFSYTSAHCGECRHTKVIANTGRCLQDGSYGESERGQHWPYNLEEGDPGAAAVAERGCRRGWIVGEETELDAPVSCAMAAKNPTVDNYHDLIHQHWLMRPRPHHRYARKCCSGGLGLYHYAVKSEEAMEWRKARGARNVDHTGREKRALRELNGRFSPHALRFVRALQERIGLEHSNPRLTFHDVPRKADDDKVACSLHEGLKITGGVVVKPKKRRAKAATDDVETREACCELCTATLHCQVFRWSREEGCVMMKEGRTADSLLGYAHVEEYTSGVVVVNECE